MLLTDRDGRDMSPRAAPMASARVAQLSYAPDGAAMNIALPIPPKMWDTQWPSGLIKKSRLYAIGLWPVAIEMKFGVFRPVVLGMH